MSTTHRPARPNNLVGALADRSSAVSARKVMDNPGGVWEPTLVDFDLLLGELLARLLRQVASPGLDVAH